MSTKNQKKAPKKAERAIQVTGCALLYHSDLGEYRLVQEKKGSDRNKWGFAKGSAQRGENVRDAIIRETLEETGWVGNCSKRPIYSWTEFRPHNGYDRRYDVYQFTPRKALDSGELSHKTYSPAEIRTLKRKKKLTHKEVLEAILAHDKNNK